MDSNSKVSVISETAAPLSHFWTPGPVEVHICSSIGEKCGETLLSLVLILGILSQSQTCQFLPLPHNITRKWGLIPLAGVSDAVFRVPINKPYPEVSLRFGLLSKPQIFVVFFFFFPRRNPRFLPSKANHWNASDCFWRATPKRLQTPLWSFPSSPSLLEMLTFSWKGKLFSVQMPRNSFPSWLSIRLGIRCWGWQGAPTWFV